MSTLLWFRRDLRLHDLPALLEPPTSDLYKRAEDVGITQVMSAPWVGLDLPPGDAERFREPIERFAETIFAKVRA